MRAEYCVIGDARRQTFFFARVREHDLIEGPDLMSEAELREKLDKIDKKMPIFTTEKLPQFERAEAALSFSESSCPVRDRFETKFCATAARADVFARAAHHDSKEMTPELSLLGRD